MKCLNLSMFLVLLIVSAACSTKKEFVKENVCSPNALTYIKRSKGRLVKVPKDPLLRFQLDQTQKGMQQCYADYMKRTGHEEFQTCMVVGVDGLGRMEYFNFSSQDIHSDQAFIQCAVKVTKKIPFWRYGKNYILLQSYNFY